MSYLRATGGIADLDADLRDATDVTAAEVRAMPPQDRAAIALTMAELAAQRRQAFWTMLQGITVGAIPLALYLGLIRRR